MTTAEAWRARTLVNLLHPLAARCGLTLRATTTMMPACFSLAGWDADDGNPAVQADDDLAELLIVLD